MITKLEELEVWQISRGFCKVIYNYTRQECFVKDFILVKQIRRSSGSIMDNIAEGFERGGMDEFIEFLGISKGTCGETRSQLYRAFDNGHIDNEQLSEGLEMTGLLLNKLGAFINYLSDSEIRNSKFKESNNA
jgi:four helix bundle protein